MSRLVVQIQGAGGGIGGGGALGNLEATVSRIEAALQKAQQTQQKFIQRAIRGQKQRVSEEERNAARRQQIEARADRFLARVTVQQARRQRTAANQAAQAQEQAAARTRRAWTRAFRAIGRRSSATLGGIGGAAGQAAGTFGSQASFLSLFASGGVGGAVRGVGGIARIGSNLAGDLVGGVTKALASNIPIVGDAIGGLLSGAAKLAGGLVGGVAQPFANIGAGIAEKIIGGLRIGLIAGIGVALVSVAKAADFERISGGFENIIQTIGGDATSSLEKFRVAARGTVSDLDLMTQANRAVLLGAISTEEQFEKLIEGGRRLGKAVGRTAAQGVEDLALGIGRQSRLILDNLGLIVKAEAAYENFAQAQGRTVSELSASEKRLAFQAEAFRALDEALARVGPEVDTFSDKWARFRARLENLSVSIGQTLLPFLERVFDTLGPIAEQFGTWLNANNERIAKGIADSVEGIATGISNLAQNIGESGLGTFFQSLGDSATRTFRIIEAEGTFFFEKLFANVEAKAKSLAASLADLFDFTNAFITDDDRQRAAEDIEFTRTRRIQGASLDRDLARGSIGDPLQEIRRFFESPRATSRAPGIPDAAFAPGFSPSDPLPAAIERNTQALERNTAATAGGAIRQTPAGASFGFSPAGQGRIPPQVLDNLGVFPQRGDPVPRQVSDNFSAFPGRRGQPGGGSGFSDIFAPGFGPATLGSDIGAEVALRIAEIKDALRQVGIDFGLLSTENRAIVEATIQQIAADAKKTQQVIERASREVDRAGRDALREQVKASKEAERQATNRLREEERAGRKIERAVQQAGRAFIRAVDAFNRELTREIEQVRSQVAGAVDQIRGEREGVVDQIRDLGRSPATEGLPRNIRQGFARAQKFEQRERTESLKQEFGSFSAGEIARSPELRERIAQFIGERETGPADRITELVTTVTEAIKDREAEAAADRDRIVEEGRARLESIAAGEEVVAEAAKGTEEATTAAAEALKTAQSNTEKALTAARMALETQKKTTEDHTKRLANIEKALSVLGR